jgi:nitrite reductase (NO-forming)
MQAKVGDKIRMYVGNGGVNLISSFHVIGEIFDTVYPNASIGGAMEHNTQATAVLPGGASIVEFTVDVPGKYLLVDHALARMNKGAWAVLEVTGDENPEIFKKSGEN